MNATDAINKIKEMLGLEFNKVEEPKEQEFAETRLEDGTTMVTNDKEGDFEMGDVIYVKDEDGTLTPAPAGEHTLSDGYVIVLDEESRLIEIRIPQSEDVGDVVDENAASEEEMSTEEEQTETMNFEEELKTIKSSIDQMLKLMETQSADFNKEIEDLKTEVETFKKSPETTGITEKKGVKENFTQYRASLLKKHIK